MNLSGKAVKYWMEKENIPIENIFSKDYEGYLNQVEYDVVLYSNDNFKADQAWILCKRLDYKNLHVLKGGINEWYSTIINPEKPTELMASNAFWFSTELSCP